MKLSWGGYFMVTFLIPGIHAQYQVWADMTNVMDTRSYQAKDVKEEEGSNRLRICKEVKQQHFITLFTKKVTI